MALPPFLKALENNDPEFAKAIELVSSTAMRPGALDAKTKVLISLALDAAQGAHEGVIALSKQARQIGTTDLEIAEALRLAYFAFGNSILHTSLAAFPEE